MKKTHWFPATAYNPVRKGWYQTTCRHSKAWCGMRWWDGAWKENKGDTDSCNFGFKCDRWRGIERGR